MSSHISKAEKQINGVKVDLDKIEELCRTENTSGIQALLNEVSSGIATGTLSLRAAEEGFSRETSMEKRRVSKQ